MIYFGWNGWGPWSTVDGAIWFVMGGLSVFGLLLLFAAIEDRRNWMRWHLLRAFSALFCLTAIAAIAGYYSWFASSKAQSYRDYLECNQRVVRKTEKVSMKP